MSTDYSDILLTADGDIDLSSDDAILISTNLDSLRQRLNIRFAIWQGEWKYNELLGTPYREYIGKAFNKATIDAEIKRQALLEPDVERLDNFSSAFDRNSRLYSCSFDVETNEESISYGLVLKDSFEYVIPNYNNSCEKIIRYNYVTSQPYPILAQDYTNNQLSINDGLIRNIAKEIEIESAQLIFNIGSGILRDILQQYIIPTESYQFTNQSITSAVITTSNNGQYTIPTESYQFGSQNIVSAVITTYNNIETTIPTESYQFTNQTLISASIITS